MTKKEIKLALKTAKKKLKQVKRDIKSPKYRPAAIAMCELDVDHYKHLLKNNGEYKLTIKRKKAK